MFDVLTNEEAEMLRTKLSRAYLSSRALSRALVNDIRNDGSGAFGRNAHLVLNAQASMRTELTSLTWDLHRPFG